MKANASDLQRTLSAICLLLSPIIWMVAEILRYNAPITAYIWSGVLSLVWVALSLQVILGLRHLLHFRSPRLAVYGCGLALILTIFATGIWSLYLVNWSLLPDMAAAEAVERAAFAKLFFVFFVPGLIYPICRAVIGIGLWRAGVVPAWVGSLMAIGYLLIPIGRLPHIPPLIYLSSILLLLTEGWLGWKILTQKSFWERNEVQNEKSSAS
jgi:hypothetical protein